ncbi:molybdate ABC transporter substrate-binding protein [[Haemophilus] ducreyi]|uniref:Molybdate-binding periplasmic protein, ABC transporter n=2 Tax=Haemophilus ducreyi TaxID=730 RepID=Q7VKQ0_HAEDU|nr:molybdate ABC transporter substrate-binding protein [[Haemophilus] ducreyi]AAP96572.1 molybdate-binding periplasmic protein, ABC transporter [[Haemophilus] ducreyi 35000HP]AKO31422.1 molybdate-binding protein [[Haemophilus] ducreyi]AKO32874.1 molybdate-binding protein [[Haemophilus] ducreyi]AKO34322.1 molybdate-binding protein [[Haemophilus] ducreyi]AKO35765.1 molybdate-binding protein [[Haemophilus] ducreyi]
MKSFKRFLISVLALNTTAVFAEDITVFAAASMTNVLQDINQAFEKAYPEDKVIFSFASSSVLAKQIEQDAPADIFISADLKWMDYIKQNQPTKVNNIQPLVKNELVLIAPKDSQINANKIEYIDFNKELNDSYLSMGDPDHVPAGRYAKKALQHYQLWESIESRLARAKNVRDALAFVQRAESPLGIVYLTDAKIAADKVKVVATFPTESYGEVIYPVATVSNKVVAKKFLDYLKSPIATAKFEAAGFYPIK